MNREPVTVGRRTKAEMSTWRNAIADIVEANAPCSVRQVYYLGIGVLWEKDTGGVRRNYRKVVDALGDMREAGLVEWDAITDSTRWRRIPTMFGSLADAFDRWGEGYRRDLWAAQTRHVEVWAESDSISGVLDVVTRPEGVGLFSCRGQASKTFIHDAVHEWIRVGKPVSVIYVGDYDPTGLAIDRSLIDRFARYGAGRVDLEFTRVAVTPDDVRNGGLTIHDVNTGDPNYPRFAEQCTLRGLDPLVAVEAEAIPPPTLRARLSDALLDLTDDIPAWNAMLAFEDSERQTLRRMREGLSTT